MRKFNSSLLPFRRRTSSSRPATRGSAACARTIGACDAEDAPLQFFIMAGCGPACANPAIPSRTKARVAKLLKWVRNSIPFSSSQEYPKRRNCRRADFIRPREFGQILFCLSQKWAARGAAHFVSCICCKSAARATENGNRTAVLRPARNVVTHRDRPLLAVGDGADAI